MEDSPLVYWADGAGSQAVFASLQDLLLELCTAVLSDRALALYRPNAVGGGYRVLSDSSDAEAEAAVANEPMSVNRRLDFDRPTSVSGIVARSRLRPHQIEFDSAISVPWADPFGHGVVLIGVGKPSMLAPALQRAQSVTAGDRLARVVDQSRMSGTLALQQQMRNALREILGSQPAAGRLGQLNALVNAAQKLFGSDTAYLALPDDGHSARYYFASLANVGTPQFRQLRMNFGQGLGGLARRERKVVRSLKYADDHRLLAPPIVETTNEGIQSAMAVPLIRADSVEGVLYVGSRTLHPYSETDERVLEEFADYISMVLGEPTYQEAVYASRSSRLREEFAHAIHDTVVRSLVQIGFTAEQAAISATELPQKDSIATIQHAAEEALANLRNELHSLVDGASGPDVPLSEILDNITAVPVRPGLTRNVYITSADARERLPSEVGDVLAHIGTEALTNSMLHSRCTTEHVHASVRGTTVRLVVSDNGVGAPTVSTTSSSSTGHFGIGSMYRRAASVNGILTITSRAEEGTTVSVEVPRTW